jgi:hypothetical protein
MILLEHFFERLEQPKGPFEAIQHAFQHFLFPKAFPSSDFPSTLPHGHSYWRVAVWGYRAQSPDEAIGLTALEALREEWAWLRGIPLPDLMSSDRVALLGLALGQNSLGPCSPEDEWWRGVLQAVHGHQPSLRAFLEYLLWRKKIESELDPDGLFTLASQLILQPSACDATALAGFLNEMRKRPYPYYGSQDTFRNMLAVYVEDHAVHRLLAAEQHFREGYPALVQKAVESQMQAVSDALAHTMARRARLRVSLAALVAMTWMVWASCYLFIIGIEPFPAKAAWEQVKWAAILFSGPVSLFLSLAGLVFFMVKGRKLSLDVGHITERYAAYLTRRWKKRLRLTQPGNV